MIDASEQILTEPSAAYVVSQIPVRTRDQLEVALRFLVGAHREEPLLLDRPQQHGLLVGTEFADFVEKHDAEMRLLEQPGAFGLRRCRRRDAVFLLVGRQASTVAACG